MSKVIIIDFGSQVTQLIARRVRELGVYSEIHPCQISADKVKTMQPDAIILSGGPASVGEKDAPTLDMGLLEIGVPVLGICYGMQLLAHNLGGELSQSETREYGPAELELCGTKRQRLLLLPCAMKPAKSMPCSSTRKCTTALTAQP